MFKHYQPLLGLVILAILFWMNQERLSELSYQEIIASLESIQPHKIFWAIILTMSGYIIMAHYDLIALRHLNYRLDWFKCISTAFSSYSISNNTGLALFIGGGIRYYFYNYYEVPTRVIAQVILMSNFNFWLGFISIGGLIFTLNPIAIPTILQTDILSIRPVGFVLLGILIFYFYCSSQQKPFGLKGKNLKIPSWGVSRDLIIVAILDRAIASLVLFMLLPPQVNINYGNFFSIYFLAIHAGIISHVPGGIGIFEAVITYFMTQYVDATAIIGSLLVFRIIYYFFPLAIALIWLLIQRLSRKSFLG